MKKAQVILILAHGILGWGEDAKQHEWTKDYFNGVKAFLNREYGPQARPDLDLVIVAPTVNPADSVEKFRGPQLKQAIETELARRPPGTRVHIVAHSMGGLDARWVIAQDGMADKIASLTTIATPHRGTAVGNVGYAALPAIMPAGTALNVLGDLSRSLLRQTFPMAPDVLEFYHHILVGFDTPPERVAETVFSLSREGVARFNQQLAEAEQAIRNRSARPVAYFAYGGDMEADRAHPEQNVLLKPSHDLIKRWGNPEEQQSPNDGLVSVWSAHYPWDDAGKEYVRTIPFAHFLQMNWRIPDLRPSDHIVDQGLQALYWEIMENILEVQRAQ